MQCLASVYVNFFIAALNLMIKYHDIYIRVICSCGRTPVHKLSCSVVWYFSGFSRSSMDFTWSWRLFFLPTKPEQRVKSLSHCCELRTVVIAPCIPQAGTRNAERLKNCFPNHVTVVPPSADWRDSRYCRHSRPRAEACFGCRCQ
jgi:hypothetical protein